jgi:hypothetical protein
MKHKRTHNGKNNRRDMSVADHIHEADWRARFVAQLRDELLQVDYTQQKDDLSQVLPSWSAECKTAYWLYTKVNGDFARFWDNDRLAALALLTEVLAIKNQRPCASA